MAAEKKYRAGIYLRLSREDVAGGGTESNSIRSQREICRAFVRSCGDMDVFDIYVDDGYSGADFDRPEFKRMMEDIKAGKINCVVVKDLSRFGRDYIEAGRLIQKTFPAFHVRFVAVTDRFDSLTADYHETSLVLPVKNFVNDSYCRDISGKVRSQQRVKREKGEFIGAFAVYGYCKDEKNRNRLVPDPYASRIVQHIFEWKLDGMSCFAIAKRLNRMGVLSPMEYKRSTGQNYNTGFAVCVRGAWSAVAVRRILTDELYIGTMVQGKSEKISYKVKRSRKKTKEEWIRVPGMHEPVIAEEDFGRVQQFLATAMRASGGEEKAHAFAGMLFCGGCLGTMARRLNRYRGDEKIDFICSAGNRGMGCARHRISEDGLWDVVWQALNFQISLLMCEEYVCAQTADLTMDFSELELLREETVRLCAEAEKYRRLLGGLDGDLDKGVITVEDHRAFQEIYGEQEARLREAAEKQEERLQKLSREAEEKSARLQCLKKAPQLSERGRDVLLAFVEKIVVCGERRIFIQLRIGDPFGQTKYSGIDMF